MEKLALDAIRGAHVAGWEYVRSDDLPAASGWRFHAMPELKALVGYAEAELGDRPEDWQALIVADDVPGFRAALGRCFYGLSDRIDIRFRVRHRDGRMLTVRHVGQVERVAGGRPHRLCGLTWDITQDVAGRERTDLIARAFDAAVGGLAICDPAFTVLEVNHALCEISGWPEEQLHGASLCEVILGAASKPEAERACKVAQRRGAWIGQLQLKRRNNSSYQAEIRLSAIRSDSGVVTHYAALIFDMRAVSRAAAGAAPVKARLPTADALLPQLEQAIKEAVGMRNGLAVFMLAIDRLSSMIETYGRPRVERILEVCEEKLRDLNNEVVMASRTEGDHFVVAISDLMEERAVEQAYASIQHALDEVLVKDKTFHLSASAGVSVFPLDGTTADVLIQRAEGALEETLRRGRGGGRLEMYKPQLSDYASDRIHIEASLRKSLKLGAFECHLQPKVRLEDGRWVGAEALMRWRIGDTWISPDRFIPIAEESGLIKDIGRWILWEAASLVAQWRREGLIDNEFRVAVNLAGAQLEGELMRTVRAVLGYNQLPSDALMLELTETIIINDPERARALLVELRNLGVRIALDDFGTGYTSMSQLQTLPLDEIKVDRSFVRGLPSDEASCAIVRSVATLAQGLKLDAVAEGIETEEQRATLMKLGYRYGQGFLFAKAMAPHEFEKGLRAAQAGRTGNGLLPLGRKQPESP